MQNHDHTKLYPLLSKANIAYQASNFEQFTYCITDCIKEMREHIHWESSKGYIKELKATHPEMLSELKELDTDHTFLMTSLEEMKNLAKRNDSQAFEIFEQFIKLRKKMINPV